ncbi:MAG: oligoendopeptidase F, partial [Bacillota bacterium]|nr:oligoendopeptidase F [Bacillota bacterium]
MTQFRGTLGQGAAAFLACFGAQEQLQKRFIPVLSYATLNLASDGASSACQAAAARVWALGAKIEAETSFIRSEALALPEGTLEGYLGSEPGLAPFRPTV